MTVQIEPIGFIRLAELLISEKPTEEQYSATAQHMEKSIRKGLLQERLGAVGRLCASMCYQLATEYRFKDILAEIQKLSDNCLAPFDEIITNSLSRRILDMVTSFCEENFQKSYNVSTLVQEIFGKLATCQQVKHQDYIHPRNMDEIKTLADIVIFTNQGSGWIIGKDSEKNGQIDLPILIENLRLFDDVLEQREIPAWMYFLSKLLARLLIRNVDFLSIHTVFHRHSRACEIAQDFIKHNYTMLWPTQVEPITLALQQKDVLLAAETGTGKSLLGAMMIAAKREQQGVSIYAVPTRALAHQVSDRIMKLVYRGSSGKVRVLTMEDEVEPEELRLCRTLVGTYEKIEGLFRQKAISSNNVNMFVVDECHNISNFDRGVTLDFLLSQTNPRLTCQRLLLSAVIPEDQGQRFAEWARSKYLRGKDWRRTRLLEKIALGRTEIELPQEADDTTIVRILEELERSGLKRRKVEEFVIEKAIELIRQGRVVLVTAESRRKVEQLADQIAKNITLRTTSSLVPDVSLRDRMEENKDRLFRYIHELKSSELILPKSTEFITRLLKRRVVFHHAGLPRSLRRIIEEMIEERIPLVVVSTSTLEAGVNFPVDVAIVKRLVLTKRMKDLKARLDKHAPFWAYAISRYENMLFSAYHNTIGRAGRAGFAEKGESIFYVDSVDDAQTFLAMRYAKTRLLGEGADLYVVSRLLELSQPDYRERLRLISKDLNQSRGRFLSNLLQVVYISSGEFEHILSILKKTWLWKIVSELTFLKDIDKGFSCLIRSELEQLVAMNFVKVGQKGYELTPLGRFVNLSLMSPISADRIIKCLQSIKTRVSAIQQADIDICILNAVGLAYEMRTSPFDRPRKLETEFAISLKERLKTLGVIFDDLSILLAAVLYKWVKGRLVDEIIEEFNLHASDHGFLEEIVPKNALWMLHCMKKLAQGIGCPSSLISRIEELSVFVSTGTDNSTAAKLLELQIPGLGRSSVLFLMEKCQPADVSTFAEIQKSQFLRLFPGKEEMASEILKQIMQRIS